MEILKEIFQNLQGRFFDRMVSNRLVYNTCWEDPRIDRRLLNIKRDSDVVMLTSAGCNAFDYLLDNPNSVHCVDTNPSQNALLNLKRALFKYNNYQLLWQFFGEGHHPRASVVYEKKLRPLLPDASRKFWDSNINVFSKTVDEPSFYFHGTTGRFALLLHRHFRKKGLHSTFRNLLDARSLPEQRYYFEEIDPHLWNGFSRWMLRQDTTMTMLGIPSSQRTMIDNEVEGGLLQFVRSALRHVFTQLPVKNNYFWRVYLTGRYTKTCCPNYLKENYFEFLRSREPVITTHSTNLSDFLKNNPGSYSHFILLDHQDWLADTHPEKLAEEWELILHNARPRARVLFRSAGTNRNFLPDFVPDQVEFQDERTQKLHSKDRVGTYGSTHHGIVKQ